MTIFRYQLIEYDVQRPWIVLASERRTVALPDNQDFDRWARAQFADDRFRVLKEDQTSRRPERRQRPDVVDIGAGADRQGGAPYRPRLVEAREKVEHAKVDLDRRIDRKDDA